VSPRIRQPDATPVNNTANADGSGARRNDRSSTSADFGAHGVAKSPAGWSVLEGVIPTYRGPRLPAGTHEHGSKGAMIGDETPQWRYLTTEKLVPCIASWTSANQATKQHR
jgi:hypothetical protein